MYDNVLESDDSYYKKFLNLLEKEISSKDFKNSLEKVQKIDLNHYTKKITIQNLESYIMEYKSENVITNNLKNIQVLLPGNPEIVFKVCLEAIRHNVNMLINIEDFCLAQNTLIVNLINNVQESLKLKCNLELNNLLSDTEIINNSKKIDKTICIGNSNLYNRLENKIDNLQLNSYGIFEMYSESEMFKELEKMIYEYTIENQFELELYDDFELQNAIELINKNGYKFCSILFSKDEENIQKFKEKINSKYVIINENPFKKIKFKLEII